MRNFRDWISDGGWALIFIVLIAVPLLVGSGIQALSTVPIGGTGRTTLTSGAILYGLGTAPVGLAATPIDPTQALCGTNPPAFALTCAGAGGGSIAHTLNVLAGDNAGNGVSAGFAASAAGIVSLFSTCSGTQYLGADGACHTPGISDLLQTSYVATAETRNSGTFAGLTTADTVTFTLGATTNVVVTFGSQCVNGTTLGENEVRFNVDGSGVAATVTKQDFTAASLELYCSASYKVSLASGAHTILMEYATLAGGSTGTWSLRNLMAFASPN